MAQAQTITTQTLQAFDAAYKLSKPKPVRDLFDIKDIGQRISTAYELATQGYQIDVVIDAYGNDPFLTMFNRQQMGYTWVPSALMPNVQVAPNVNFPGYEPYDPANPPKGAITVTTDAADLKPYDPPVKAVTSPQAMDPVGTQISPFQPQMYFSLNPALADGFVVENSRGKFMLRKFDTPFGPQAYFIKQ